jgi:polyhydroxyalkanoate synthase
MASKASQEGQRHRAEPPEPAGSAVPGSLAAAFSPEAALGVWSAWMKSHVGGTPAGSAPGFGGTAAPTWLMAPEPGAAVGVGQIADALAKDPMLATVDRMWNANPLHEVIPVDWAEVVRALRTVWLRRMADPGRVLPAMVETNVRMWQAAVEAWNGAAARWWGLAEGAAAPAGLGAGDKRFEAPEWHANPVYRTLKDMYLLASDFLLMESEAEDLDPAERERLRFHLEQFVNATSPTLLLLSNPAALRRAMETGGASIAAPGSVGPRH